MTRRRQAEEQVQNNVGQEAKQQRPSLRTPSILAQRARPSTSGSYVVCYIGACLLAGATWTASIRRTHQNVLGLFDEEGLAILAQLHVQAHRLPVDLYVHLQEDISLGDDETSCPTFRF